MARMSRDKGKRFEREVAALIRDVWGIAARRGRQYAGHPDAPDVVAEIPGCYIEAKRRERENVSAWMDEAESMAQGLIPMVVHRKSRKRMLVTVPAERFRELVERVAEATKR